MKNIPLEADVQCKDGLAGKSSAVIVDPESLQVTHFVVKEKSRPHREYLVPIEYAQETTENLIQLNSTLEELQAMNEFLVTTYRQVEMVRYTAVNLESYYTPEIVEYKEQKELVPEGELAVRSGSDVLTSDGAKVGRVTNLLEDPTSGRITHFNLREDHLWGNKDIVVPTSLVRFVDKSAVHLKIDKQTVSAMLAIPSRGSVTLTDAVLALVTFPETEKARAFLDRLQKETAVQFSNAAVLVKDRDGKASLQETHDVDKRHGAVFGAIAGGLVGLLGGPAGVIIGTAAGAATGRVAGGRIDLGFPDEYLKKLQAGLQPGSSALVVLLKRRQTSKLDEAAVAFGGQCIQQDLTQDILANLADNSEV